MNITNKQYETTDGNIINYYETGHGHQVLLLIHAQGTNSYSYENIVNRLSNEYHLILVDCYGHGKSSHNKDKYSLINIGNDFLEFIQSTTSGKINILGHSSGGLIACYLAANSDLCSYLLLEDPPLFSSCGERRYKTFNYVDLSTICHNFIGQDENEDFVYYYFAHQYAWHYFPEKSREKVKSKLCASALKYRTKHPNANLKVPFWPKKALEVFNGMNEYDPYFGEAFYNDSFNANINYEELLRKIKSQTLIMKAKTMVGEDGIMQGAMLDDDLQLALACIPNSAVEYFECGHGIHTEKKKDFVKAIISTTK